MKKKIFLLVTLGSVLLMGACQKQVSVKESDSNIEQTSKQKKVKLSQYIQQSFDDEKKIVFFKTTDENSTDSHPQYALVFQNSNVVYYNLNTDQSLSLEQLSSLTVTEQLEELNKTHKIAYLEQLNKTKKKLVEILDDYDQAIKAGISKNELNNDVKVQFQKENKYELSELLENKSSSMSSTRINTLTLQLENLEKTDLGLDFITDDIDLSYLEIPYDLTVDRVADEWYEKTDGSFEGYTSERDWKTIQSARKKISYIDDIIINKKYSELEGFEPLESDFTLSLVYNASKEKAVRERLTLEVKSPVLTNWLSNSDLYNDTVIEPVEINENFSITKQLSVNDSKYSVLATKDSGEAIVTRNDYNEELVLDTDSSRYDFLEVESEPLLR